MLDMIDSHDRAIGRMEGKPDRLIEEQAHIYRHRAGIYQKIELIQRKQDRACRQIVAMGGRMERVEIPVAESNRWRKRAADAMMLTSFITAEVG